jgi:hypothetical protein
MSVENPMTLSQLTAMLEHFPKRRDRTERPVFVERMAVGEATTPDAGRSAVSSSARANAAAASATAASSSTNADVENELRRELTTYLDGAGLTKEQVEKVAAAFGC